MTKANLKRLEEGKLYYSISEVCSMTGLEQHVLRYWETEFPQLRPKKNRSGNRAYRSKEIKIIRYIKYLLYEELYTIPGAKRKMADANMADLDGQLSLIRMAPDAVPVAATAVAAPALAKEAYAAVPVGAGGGEMEGDDHLMEAHGSEEEARLREEVARLKAELKALLAILDGRGRGAP
jgi:DNA-binding transcriptional MerR regulator